MHRRLLHHYAITSRRNDPGGITAPSDFGLAFQAGDDIVALPPSALPYCLDIEGERMLYTGHAAGDLPQVFAAPFLFDAQLRTAISIVSVPFERLVELAMPDPAPRPTYLFSPGRTGSTLLARLSRQAGLATASEPDVLSQVAYVTAAHWQRMPTGMDVLVAAACLHALQRALGGLSVVKLRSQCNERPLPLVAAAPGCRVVFMLRGAAGWGLSRHRAFGDSADRVASAMREAFDAIETLQAAGVAFDVLWFEDLVRDPMAALRLCAPGASIAPDRLARIMADDSQVGTNLARAALEAAAVEQGFLSEFGRAWVRARAGTAWSARTEALVAQMVST